MNKTDKLIKGDYVYIRPPPPTPSKFKTIQPKPIGMLYLGPRQGPHVVSLGYRFQNASGKWTKGKTGFDRKSCQKWVTIIIRDGVTYRYHPSEWGPLWIK